MTLKSHIFSYTGVNILNASVPFLLLPLLTSYLNPSDYGLLSLIQLLMILSLPIVLMNTQGILVLEYSNLSKKRFQDLVSTIILIPIIGFLFLEVFFINFEVYIIKYFHIPSAYVYYIPFFVLLQSIPTIVSIIFQAKKKPIQFGKYKLSMTVVNITLSIVFVIVFNLGWEGRINGIVISFALFTVIGLIILKNLKLLKFCIDKIFLIDALKFGLPLIPHAIAGIFLTMSDRVFLINMIDAKSVGIYSVAFQVSSAVTIIMSSINQAWAPSLYEKLNNNPTLEDKKALVKITYRIMGFMILITLFYIFLSPFLFELFINQSYHSGKILSIYIAIAFLFQGFYFLVTNYIFYSKKTYLLSYITVSLVIIILTLNYFLIGLYGINGAAYSMLFGWILFFFITWRMANKVYPMPWRLND